MSACHREVCIDHESNLSLVKESVIQLSFLHCQIDSFLEVQILHDLLQRESIFASSISKFGIRFQRIECDVLRSSTELSNA